MSILITTYEGNHNHPLPVSATAMASTTSAAASMLLSGSTSSRSGGLNPSATTTTSASFHGFNFYISDNTKLKQLYLQNSSVSSSHPTITLDLTSNPSSSSSLFNKFPSNYPTMYSSTSLNFGSSESNNNAMSWSNNGFLSYGPPSQPYNVHRNNQIGNLSLGRQTTQNNVYQNFMQKNGLAGLLPQHHSYQALATPTHQAQQGLPDSSSALAAATKAITADPSFQSALAAALSSIIGGGGGTQGNHQGGGDVAAAAAKKLKWGPSEECPANNTTTTHQTYNMQTATTSSKGNGCAISSYLNTTTPTNSQPVGNSVILSSTTSFPFSNSKSSASASSGDHGDQITK